MITTLTLAIDNRISLYRLRNSIVPYPTRSDSIKRLADTIVFTGIRNIKSDIVWYIKKRIPILIGLTLW